MAINKRYSLTIVDELDLIRQNVVSTIEDVASGEKLILFFETDI